MKENGKQEPRKLNRQLQREIERRKSAEEALRQSERHFHLLIKNSSEAIGIVDAEGTIRYLSPSYERLLGYIPDQVVGNSMINNIDPGDVGYLGERFAQLLQDPGGTTTVEVRAQHQDGSWRIIEATGNNYLDDPAVQGIVINFRDITERREAEAILKESEERYRSLVEMSPEGILIHSGGVFLYANPAALRIYGANSRDQIVGRPLLDFVNKEDRDLGIAKLRLGQEEPESINTFEVRIDGVDGKTRDVEVYAGSIVYRVYGSYC